MKPLLVFLAVVVLAICAPTLAAWIAPHHPRSITARRNQRGWG